MRVLHLLHDVRDSGNGIVHVAVDVATHQHAAGHTVAVASGAGAFSELLLVNGVDWFLLPLSRKPRDIVLAGFRFGAIVRRFRPDIVHAHTLLATIVARAFRFGSSYRIVATAHRVYDRGAALHGLADSVIALSDANSEALVARGIQRAKLHVVRNGTIGTLRRRVASGTPQIELVGSAIVTVAGLFKRKGIDVLIAAFGLVAEAHRNAQLYIVGEGPDRELFQNLAASLACTDRIHFVGFTPTPASYLRASSVFVLASRRESFPLVLIEAREARCAIVATNVDGASEALDGGLAGILVSPNNPLDLAAAIDKLLSDRKLAEEYRASAGRSLQKFNAERMALDTLAAYQPHRPTVEKPSA